MRRCAPGRAAFLLLGGARASQQLGQGALGGGQRGLGRGHRRAGCGRRRAGRGPRRIGDHALIRSDVHQVVGQGVHPVVRRRAVS
jgi:hypothetical protein